MPVLSVVIPTHNRQKYAINAIETILNNFTANVEVVVSDTSDDYQIADSLASWINSGRLSYNRPNEPMNAVKNFEYALNFVSGDYIVYIGDDDCIGPDIEKIALWAKENNIDGISGPFCATYGWPNFKSQYFKNGYASKLAIRKYTGKPFKIRGAQILQHTLDSFVFGPLEMPRLYHGMVSRKLIDKIKSKYGHVFGGVSPDVYNAALVTYEGEKLFKLDFPFIIIGGSGESTAGAGATGTHKAELRKNSHISAFKNLEWDNLIPAFYSPETVWSFSLLKALEKINDNKLKPNFARLYIRCFIFHRDFISETKASFKIWIKQEGAIKATFLMINAAFSEVIFQFKRVWRRLPNIKNPFPRADTYGDLESIAKAFNTLSLYTQSSSKKLKIDIKQPQ